MMRLVILICIIAISYAILCAVTYQIFNFYGLNRAFYSHILLLFCPFSLIVYFSARKLVP